MHDREILAASMESTFKEIASQAEKLGTALLDAAPAGKESAPSTSVEYLLESAKANLEFAEACKQFLSSTPRFQK